MLNRIKVRGKLLLLLTTPLLALVIFAYLGIVDRLDTAAAQTREERLAQLADAGSDLGQTVAHERLVGMIIDAGGGADISIPAAATREAMSQWLTSATAARRYVRDPATRSDMAELSSRLNARLARGDQSGRSTTTLLAELSILSRSISGINDGLVQEADDLGLYRAMFVQGFAGEMQNASTEIAVVGSNAIRTGEISPVARGLLQAADATLTEASTELQALGEPKYVSMLADLRNSGVVPRVAGQSFSSVSELAPLVDGQDPADRVGWLQLGLERVDGIHGISDELLQDASAVAAAQAAVATDSAKNFMVLAGAVGLVALLMAVLIGRSISRPLVRLSRSARQLSDQELPALVESMRTGGRIVAPEIAGIEIKGRDEVAQLSHPVAEIQKVTVEVAEEQTALLHRGISTMFINLARRNQSLLDRQIQFIDGLERAEEDPDQLNNLFQLDHLATRMRRNAESLLVLAGGEPSHRRGQPVPVDAVLRVAVSEIEDYSRVDLRSIEPSLMPSSAAVDMAHLASELMENATQFSPPDSRVDVVGHRIADGAYQLTIADHGFGMTDEQITEANRTLARPPVVGLDMGRSLGFTVVAKIAHRLGLTVRLTATLGGGLTAVVTMPPSMQVDAERAAEAPVEMQPHEPELAVNPDQDPEPESEPLGHPEPATSMSADTDIFEMFDTHRSPSTTVADPKADLFAGLASEPTGTNRIRPRPSVTDSPEPKTRVSKLPPPPPIGGSPSTGTGSPVLPRRTRTNPAASAHGADSAGETPRGPDRDDSGRLTRSGLTRRTPGRSVADQPAAPDGRSSEAVSPSGRSPEEIREMLSRYRGGLQRGHVPGDQSTTGKS